MLLADIQDDTNYLLGWLVDRLPFDKAQEVVEDQDFPEVVEDFQAGKIIEMRVQAGEVKVCSIARVN